MTGFAAKHSSQITIQQAIEEIARVHFGGDTDKAAADLIAFFQSGDLYAFVYDGERPKKLRASRGMFGHRVDSDQWRKYPDAWREDPSLYLYREQVQQLYRHTLWNDVLATEAPPEADETAPRQPPTKTRGETEADYKAWWDGKKISLLETREWCAARALGRDRADELYATVPEPNRRKRGEHKNRPTKSAE